MKAGTCAVFGSLGVSFASVVCLNLNDYNIFNAEIWLLGFKVIMHAPLEFIENFTSGPDKMLFVGIATSLGGMFIAAFLIAVFVTVRLIEKVVQKAAGPGFFSSCAIGRDSVGSISPKKGRRFVRLFLSRVRCGLARYCAMIALALEKASKMTAEGAVSIGTLPTMPLPFVKQFGSWISAFRQSQRVDEENARVVTVDGDFYKDLQKWHVAASGVPRDDKDTIASAKTLLGRANHGAREQVMERDAISGELMLRMMEDWALNNLSQDAYKSQRSRNALTEHSGNNLCGILQTADVPSEEDVSIPQIDEIGKSGELFVKWLALAKKADATGVNIARPLIIHDENGYRMTGIAHLVLEWGSCGKSIRRVNVIFRHVPKGTWSLEKGSTNCDDMRMVNESGGYVNVSRETVSHPDIAGGITVIHFHGPGASHEMYFERDNLIVTTSAPDAAGIRDIMERFRHPCDSMDCDEQKNA